MKKGDIFIIASVAAAFVLSLVLTVLFLSQSSRVMIVVIKQDNQIVYNKSIDINATVKLKNNTVTVEDKSVYMSEADCNNKACINEGKISKKGESIVCLPNKVIVEIK